MVLTRGLGKEGSGGYCFMDTVSLWEDEKVLGEDGGDGCATGMYLGVLTVHLSMVKMVSFRLSSCHHNKRGLGGGQALWEPSLMPPSALS